MTMVQAQQTRAGAGGESQRNADAGAEELEDIEVVIARLKAMMAAAEAAKTEAGQAPAEVDEGSTPPVDHRPDGQAAAREAAAPEQDPAQEPNGAEVTPGPSGDRETETNLSAPLAEPVARELAAPVADPMVHPAMAPLTVPLAASAADKELSNAATEPRPEPSDTTMPTTSGPDHFDFG